MSQAGVVDGQRDLLAAGGSGYQAGAAHDVAQVLGACTIHGG